MLKVKIDVTEEKIMYDATVESKMRYLNSIDQTRTFTTDGKIYDTGNMLDKYFISNILCGTLNISLKIKLISSSVEVSCCNDIYYINLDKVFTIIDKLIMLHGYDY